MSVRETVPTVTPGQVRELGAALIQAIPLDLPKDLAQALIGDKTGIAKRLRQMLMPTPNIKTCVQEWVEFYGKFFRDLPIDFFDIQIPDHRPGFNQLIVVPKGLALNLVYLVCSDLFSCQCWTLDLDNIVTTNDRSPADGTYAIWIRDRVEADNELAGLSATGLRVGGIPGITLLERLLLELKCFRLAGKHLDTKSITLCSGSRLLGRYVPSVCWEDDGLLIRRDSPSIVEPCLRSREVVALPQG